MPEVLARSPAGPSGTLNSSGHLDRPRYGPHSSASNTFSLLSTRGIRLAGVESTQVLGGSFGVNSLQFPSEMTSTMPPDTLRAVSSSIA